MLGNYNGKTRFFWDLNMFKISLDFDLVTHTGSPQSRHCQLFERLIHMSRVENAFGCYFLGNNGDACPINTKWTVKN
jgi:hypothetical protein